ncbi:hypothetical protein GJAV_G00187930 [Gymnothorax javanicus]|nr:hypothetical protein GJAV_G00187930 [Gymnothorax javanicus]
MVSEDVYKTHINLKVGTAGFRISNDKPYIGVSCDACVSCECFGDGVFEAKCPFKWANNYSTKWTEDERGHLDTFFSLKMNHSYYTQVQMQMFTCNADYADFVTWTPQQSTILCVPQNEDFLMKTVATISRFWARRVPSADWNIPRKD